MRCRIQCCNLPVEKEEVFNPETMNEPFSGEDGFCKNQDGFHDHKKKVWFKFVPARVSNKRFENSLA